jgi:hypothetical protein
MGNWRTQVGDLVPSVAAQELDLPLRMVRWTGDPTPLRDQDTGPAWIDFIYRPGHYVGAWPTAEAPPQVPWQRLRPGIANTPALARARFNALREPITQARDTARDRLRSLLASLPVDQRRAGENQLRAVLDRFHAAYTGGDAYEGIAEEIRADNRLDAMRKAVQDLEDLISSIEGGSSS